MSWFDTSNLANLAKSALKEAQKTIDKALDISESQQAMNSNEDAFCTPEIQSNLPLLASTVSENDSNTINESNSVTNIQEHEKSPVSSDNGIEVLKTDSGEDEVEISVTSFPSDLEIIPNFVTENNCLLKIDPKLHELLSRAFQNSNRFIAGLSPNQKCSKAPSSECLTSASHNSDETIDLDKMVRYFIDLNEVLDTKHNQYQDLQKKYSILEQKNANLLQTTNLNENNHENLEKITKLHELNNNKSRELDLLKSQLKESNELNKQLRSEGEQLSQTVLKLNNVIKALRTKEKNDLSSVMTLKEQIELLRNENEDLSKSLKQMTESEEEYSEKIKQLENNNKKFENENDSLKNTLEDLTEKLNSTKSSLNIVKHELLESKRNNAEFDAKERLLQQINNEKLRIENENIDLKARMDSLQKQLKTNELNLLANQEKFQHECANLVQKIEELNLKNENLSNQLSSNTKPLYKRIEYLQIALNEKITALMKLENDFKFKLEDSTNQLENNCANEKFLKEKLEKISLENNELKLSYNDILKSNQKLQESLDDKIKQFHLSETNFKIERNDILLNLENYKNQIDIYKTEIINLNNDRDKILQELERLQNNSQETLLERRLSLTESITSLKTESENEVESKSVYETMRYQSSKHNSDNLMKILKQKDTEIQVLKLEINQKEAEKLSLNSEIAKLFLKIEKLEERIIVVDSLTNELEELRNKYDALCIMYGEKVEEINELKLDLQDVNSMYKSQINDLLEQLNKLSIH